MTLSSFELISDWPDSDVSVATIIVQDKLGRVLLQLRDDFDHVGAHGRWGIFGGHVEHGEAPLDAAIRELNEEIGIDVDRHGVKPYLKLVPDTGYRVHHYVFQMEQMIEPHEISVAEGAGFAFITGRQIKDFNPIPSVVMILNEMLKKGHLAL